MSLGIVPEIVKSVKESCLNISVLHVDIFLRQSLNEMVEMISLICELSSLKILEINVGSNDNDILVNLG